MPERVKFYVAKMTSSFKPDKVEWKCENLNGITLGDISIIQCDNELEQYLMIMGLQ